MEHTEDFNEFGDMEKETAAEEAQELFQRIKSNSITKLSDEIAAKNQPKVRTPPVRAQTTEAPVVSGKTLAGLIDQVTAVKKLLVSSQDPKIKQAVVKLSEAVSWMTSAAKK